MEVKSGYHFDPALLPLLEELGAPKAVTETSDPTRIREFLRPRIAPSMQFRLDAPDHRRRFIIADPVARRSGISATASLNAAGRVLSGHEARSSRRLATSVFTLTTLESEVIRQHYPDLRVQEDYPCVLASLAHFGGLRENAYSSATARTSDVQVINEQGEPVEAMVTVKLSSGRSFTVRTDPTTGKGTLSVPHQHTTAQSLQVHARAGYWPGCQEPHPLTEAFVIQLKALPAIPPALRAHAIGGVSGSRCTGDSVKVGVIDSGFGDHPNLVAEAAENFTSDVPEAVHDASGHGTHVAGIIGARGEPFAGYAPGCNLYNLRAFDDAQSSVAVVSDALRRAVELQLDVVNMSFTVVAQTLDDERELREMVEAAYQAGIVTVSAVGNDYFGVVGAPAVYPRTMGVASMAEFDQADAGQYPKSYRTSSPSTQYYTPSFSNVGPQVDFAAPGIGIVSTVPGGFAAMSGTSMSAPHVSGLAALILEKHRLTGDLPAKGPARVDFVRVELERLCRSLGLGVDYQGQGMPLL